MPFAIFTLEKICLFLFEESPLELFNTVMPKCCSDPFLDAIGEGPFYKILDES